MGSVSQSIASTWFIIVQSGAGAVDQYESAERTSPWLREPSAQTV
jgi:hypothetical protein